MLCFRQLPTELCHLLAIAPIHGVHRLAVHVLNVLCMLRSGPDSLADDLWQNILCQLSLTEVLNCSRVCKRWHGMSQHDTVWKCLYKNEFSLPKAPELVKCWKQAFHIRAQKEHLRLRQERQARLLKWQSKVQVSGSEFRQAKTRLVQEQAKLAKYQEELQALKRLRTTANATQCWTPAAVSKGFEKVLAQAPIESSWQIEKLQQSVLDSRLHCQTLERSLLRSKHDYEKSLGRLKALQGA